MKINRFCGMFVCSLVLALASAASAEDAVSLFDGKSLDGWDGNPKFWSVKDDAITGTTTAEKPDERQHLPDLEEGRAEGF